MVIGAQEIATAIIPAFCIGTAAGVVITKKCRLNRRCATAIIYGIEYAFAAARFGITWHCVHICILFTLLSAAAFYDLDTMEIPDMIHVAAACVFMVFLPLEGNVISTFIRGMTGALTVGGAILLLSWCAERVTGHEALGGGDIKLFAVLGLHFGAIGGAFAVIVSCLAGLVICGLMRIGKGTPFPFAPSIAFGAFVTAIAGEELINLYIRAFR